SRIPLAALALNPHFPRAGENLPSDEKRQDAGDNPIPRDIAGHQVIVMATIAVAGKIGVVLVKADLVAVRQFFISAACALCKDALTGLILGTDLLERCALWRRIFRVRVFVVEPRAV